MYVDMSSDSGYVTIPLIFFIRGKEEKRLSCMTNTSGALLIRKTLVAFVFLLHFSHLYPACTDKLYIYYIYSWYLLLKECLEALIKGKFTKCG